MPIYEYICDDCEKKCEVIQKITDQPLSTCPECGGRMHKLISQTSFVLKGSGWYVTDYASPERKKAQDADGSDHSTLQEKSATKTDRGTDTKAESRVESASKS